MPLPLATAFAFAGRLRRRAEMFRDYAVTDFIPYYTTAMGFAEYDDIQRAWATFLHWSVISNKYPDRYGRVAGKRYDPSDPTCAFRYTPGDGFWEKPKLHPDGVLAGRVAGHGQCGYFAEQAFNDAVTLYTTAATSPLIEQVSNGVHNWVRLNHDPAHPRDSIFMDYWGVAIGCRMSSCIYIWSAAHPNWRPVSRVERRHPAPAAAGPGAGPWGQFRLRPAGGPRP